MILHGVKSDCNPNTVFAAIRKHRRKIPYLYAWLADLPRLCHGAATWALIFAVLARTQTNGWTPHLEKEWLATVCRVDRRSLDREIGYLESSRMADVKHSWGAVSIRLCFKRWPKLPDRVPVPRVVEISKSA